MLTPIEDLGFSHDVEQDDGERDGFETVHAKLTAQWYVDPNDPKWGWNVERPGYVLREREVFLDGALSTSPPNQIGTIELPINRRPQ